MPKGDMYLIKNRAGHMVGAFTGADFSGGDRLNLFLPVFDICQLSVEKVENWCIIVANDKARQMILQGLRLKEPKNDEESVLQMDMINILEAV